MRASPADWTREKIRAAVAARGYSFAALAREHGYSEGACRTALIKHQPAGERAIAACLQVPVQEIWPSRYFPDGRSRSRPWRARNPSARNYPPHRQIGAAQ